MQGDDPRPCMPPSRLSLRYAPTAAALTTHLSNAFIIEVIEDPQTASVRMCLFAVVELYYLRYTHYVLLFSGRGIALSLSASPHPTSSFIYNIHTAEKRFLCFY